VSCLTGDSVTKVTPPVMARGGSFFTLLLWRFDVWPIRPRRPGSGISRSAVPAGLSILHRLRVAQGFGHELLQVVGSRMRVSMGTAQGFGDDLIDHAELLEVLARQLKALSKLRAGAVVFKEDRGACFWGR